MFDLLRDPTVSQIMANSHDRIFFTNREGTMRVNEPLFPTPADYLEFLNRLLLLTDSLWQDVRTAPVPVIEASFRGTLYGSVHICTREITRGDPVLTIRKQPIVNISLDQMLDDGMLNTPMRLFLELAVRGRLNILLSGGSGAGKTTMARALAEFIAPHERVLTVEEIDELHLGDRLPNVVALTTSRIRDTEGRPLRETTLNDLVREGLRMRADRIWVGETRGKEAYALVKACNSGHDGSVTTVHGDDDAQAVRQLVTYVMEAGVSEEVARDQVARAFDLVIQIERVAPGRRAVTMITELESTREGTEQRRSPLFTYDHEHHQFLTVGAPTPALLRRLGRYGVTVDPVIFTGWHTRR